jgi:uncharacterized protein
VTDFNDLEGQRSAPPPLVLARIHTLDVIRGLAILGILVMNILDFSTAEEYHPWPVGLHSTSSFEFWNSCLGILLFRGKFLTIFSLLFGAGIVLMAERRAAVNRAPWHAHYRRMGALLVLGCLHGFLLWHGDILFAYALAGTVAYWFRHVRAWKLLVLGLLLVYTLGLFLQIAASFLIYEFLPMPDSHYLHQSWPLQMQFRVPRTAQCYVFALISMPDLIGRMLIGMALYKFAFLSGACSKRIYTTSVLLAVFGVFPIVGYFSIHGEFVGRFVDHFLTPLVSLAWISLAVLASGVARLTWITSPLAAVGRMSLTNYLLQTLLCTTLFYGHGFNLLNHVNAIGQWKIVVAIWLLQLCLSPLWLRFHHMGPMEWLLRCITYARLVPLRKHLIPIKDIA